MTNTAGPAGPVGPALALGQGFVVLADESRWGEAMHTSAEHVWTKVSQKDTGGAWSLFESRVPAGFGVPLHLHHEQEEWFWILQGEFEFEVGGEVHRLGPGASQFAPRHVPHRWRKTGEADGVMLILAQPSAGMEDFFDRFAQLSPEQLQDFAYLNGLFAECGMEVVGPPLPPSDDVSAH